jgi:hypothetical protein
MPADFPSPQTAAPTLKNAAPASASPQKASYRYVHERYGELGAAMTANVITYWGKSAARKVGKQPYWSDNLMKRRIRPAGQKAGIQKRAGWHTPTEHACPYLHRQLPGVIPLSQTKQRDKVNNRL